MKYPGQVTITRQAPETTAGSDTVVSKRAVAKHELLSATGDLVESEEEASGIRYTVLANNQSFDYQHGKNADLDRMLACFGAKTLATNESSAIRNNPKGEGTPDEQIDAVRERFALLESGKWVDRTREGVGAKLDLDTFANAICNVMVAEGKWTEEQVKTGKMAETRGKLDDAAYRGKARKFAAFVTEYGRLKGQTSVSIDDFAA